MATQLFLVDVAATTHRATNAAKLDGSTSGWLARALSTARGDGVGAVTTNTVAGTTNGVEIVSGSGFPYEFISDPVSSDVTISGAVTGNIWASESNMSANVAINFVVDVIRAVDNTVVEIVKSTRVTEVAVTTRAVNNFTATPGAGVLVNRGDRLRVRVFGDDAGTMASGFAFSTGFDGTTAGADGDTYVTFTETFAFESLSPAGTVIYLTDTASDVATAAVDREAWTSRGAGVQTDVTNTAAGWTAPIQITDTAGGTVVDWFTKPLAAFTLGGVVKANLRLHESSLSANASARVDIARVDGDGTNAASWGTWALSPLDASTLAGEILNSQRDEVCYVSGDDLAISDGQRLRIRVLIDDNSETPLVTGHTVTLSYAGTSGGASGDTFLTFTQTLTEFVAAVRVPYRNPMQPLIAQ